MLSDPNAPRPGGFALPWALFTLVALSLLVASGFLITWLESRAARAFSLGTAAFYAAEGGLATALATATGPTPSVSPIAIGRGTARVAFDKLIDIAPGESLYRVTAEGRVTSGGSTIRRRVGRLAWVADPPRLPATLVAWGGTAGTGPSGSVSGFDAGSGCPGTPASIAGLASLAAGPPPFPSLALAGSPPTLVWPPGTSLAAETGIRWTELLAPYGPRPDATVPPDPWPGPSAGGGWPFIRLAGPATIGGGRSGRGTLVVDGDLTIGAGFSWTGLVLVGGALSFRGAATIRGGALAGLAGAAAPALDLGSAALDLRYDACAVARAAGRITAPAAGLPGTWFEAW